MTKITKKAFGTTKAGDAVTMFTLDNGTIQADIIDYGGTVVAIRVPDKNGDVKDVALGYETVTEYEERGGFLGALIGRCGNRIERGTFTLDGVTYNLYCNDGKNHLHGGKIGYDKKMWTGEIVNGTTGDELKLGLFSPDGEENYPGNLTIAVTYRINAENGLEIDYHAETDKNTVCNLTNHTYFNLAGQGSGNILGHQMKLHASRYTVGNEETIPNGEIAPVAGTPYDFTEFHLIGERIDDDEAGLKYAGGYDHNWALDVPAEGGSFLAAEAICPDTGIRMDVYTDLPGIQFFCANGMSEKTTGKGGVHYCNHGGFCLETQVYPNGMKFSHFPSPVLMAGDVYSHKTEYRFSIEK